MPKARWTSRPATHHNDVTAVSRVMRRPTPTAWRSVTSRSTKVACTNHRIGPNITSTRDVAFTPPTVSVTSAKIAGVAQSRRRSARAARPMSHGSPAKGSRMTEIRAAYSSRYGLSAYVNAAMVTPAPSQRSSLSIQRTPSPAARMIDPNHSRWATQSGRPTASISQ